MKKIYFLLVVLLVGNFAYGQTLIVGQDFESDTEWAFTADPAAYSESGDKDIWAAVTTVGSSNNGLDAAQSGTKFWGMRDLDNPYISTSPDSVPPGLGLTNPYNHTLTFQNVAVTGKANVELSFYYNAYSLNNGYLKVELFFDNVSQGEEVVFSDASGTATDGGWVKYTTAIPEAIDSVKMTIHAYNDQDYLAMDNIKLEADVAPSCPITLGATTATCDTVTDGVDTYTATVAYTGAGGETYTVTATSGTVGGDDPSTVADGTISVSGVEEGTDVTVTIAGGLCNEEVVITASTCVPESPLDALPLEESFDYEVGTNLSDHGNWEDLFSGDTITISEGNLDYEGLKASKGNSVTFSENGLDANLPFISETTGAVYSSFLFKVSDLSTLTKNGYFVVLGNDYNARFWLQPDGDQFVIGVSVGSKLNVITTEKYSLNDVIFAVMNYDFADSTCNVWVNPASTDFEAENAPEPTISEGGGGMQEIGRIMLRQDSNTETPTITVDELRVGLTWASVTPKAGAVAEGDDWNFSDEQFVALSGDLTETQTISGLTIYASADKTVTIGESASTIGDMEYTHRLKLNGSGTLDESNVPVGRVLSFDVTGNTLISVALTSANSSSDRMLNVAAGSPENVIAQIQATGGVKDVQEFTYTGEATTIYIYSDNSGINLYQLKATPLAPTKSSWNFSDEEFVALEGEITETTTVSGLTIYASADKNVTIGPSASTIGDVEYTHRMKLNGSGSFDESNVPVGRILSFDVTGNTSISVALTSANSSSDRMLNIAVDSVNNVVGQIQATGGVKDVQEYSYTGEAATIYLYSDNSGINLYEIITKSVPTGITQIKNDFDVNVYPNPADDKVFIDVNEPTQVGIYNIAGSLLKSKLVQSKSDYINIVDLKEGIYIIRSMDSNSFAKKLIVK